MTQQDQLLTKDQVAKRWNCSKRTVDRIRREGNLPWMDLSHGRGAKPLVRFREEDVQAYETVTRMAPFEQGVRENGTG